MSIADPSPTPAAPPFTPADQERFAALKSALTTKLPRSRPDSGQVFECSLHFAEIRDRAFHRIDQVEDMEAWTFATFGIRRHQVNKYYSVARGLSAAEVAGKTVGIEVLDQLARTPPSLRGPLWPLAEEQGLSPGSLSAARRAGLPLLRRGLLERAVKEAERAAWRQCDKEEQEESRRRSAAAEAPAQRIGAGLDRLAQRLERLIGAETPLRAQDLQALRAPLQRLGVLSRGLAELALGAEERTLPTSTGDKTKENQPDRPPAAAPPAPAPAASAPAPAPAASAPAPAPAPAASAPAPAPAPAPAASAPAASAPAACASAPAPPAPPPTQEDRAMAAVEPPPELVTWLADDLAEYKAGRVEQRLFAVVRGAPLDDLRAELRALVKDPREPAGPEVAAAVESWLAQVAAGGPGAAALAALRLAVAAQVPGLDLRLRMLRLRPPCAGVSGALAALPDAFALA